MPGILSSCCPFLSNATKETPGSPPYSRDLRLRLHNWTNSLSGSSQIPRQVSASTRENPGLPQFSTDSSVISFQKSDVSVEPSEGECTVILAARDGCSQDGKSLTDTAINESQSAPDGDWETEKGQEEEEVNLIQRMQIMDEECSGLSLERKEAKTALPLETKEEFSAISSFLLSKATINSSSSLEILQKTPESPIFPDETETGSDPILTKANETTRASSSADMVDAETMPPEKTAHEPSQTSPLPEMMVGSSAPPPEAQPDPLHASSSSELLDAISSLAAGRSAKSRRSRMTNTRAPTPWSAPSAEPADDEAAADSGDEPADDETLDRASSSAGSSPYGSAAGTAESSYHTLPTPASSAEHAGAAEQRLPDPAAAAGDQRPPPAAGHDDVSLRYFCGAFRPDDHFMTLHAGLEAVPEQEAKRPLVAPGLSDSAVERRSEAADRRQRAAASDSRLPPSERPPSPGLPAADGSGVALEAKRSDTALPL